MRQEESNARAHSRDKITLSLAVCAITRAARSWIIWQEPRAQSYAYRPRPVHELYLYPAPGSLADIDAARQRSACSILVTFTSSRWSGGETERLMKSKQTLSLRANVCGPVGERAPPVISGGKDRCEIVSLIYDRQCNRALSRVADDISSFIHFPLIE